MKRIVNCKRYDTEKATLIVECGSGGSVSRTDFEWDDTYLYRTQSGSWFLAGVGGPMSMWGKRSGSGFVGGTGIRPIDELEVIEILEREGAEEVLEQYFADRLQDA